MHTRGSKCEISIFKTGFTVHRDFTVVLYSATSRNLPSNINFVSKVMQSRPIVYATSLGPTYFILRAFTSVGLNPLLWHLSSLNPNAIRPFNLSSSWIIPMYDLFHPLEVYVNHIILTLSVLHLFFFHIVVLFLICILQFVQEYIFFPLLKHDLSMDIYILEVLLFKKSRLSVI